MAKEIKSVYEVIAEITPETGKDGKVGMNRFNKAKFNDLMLAIVNDNNFKDKVVKKSNAEKCEVEDVLVTQNFRKWFYKAICDLMDANDAKIVLDDNWKIKSVDGLYEFFCSCVYTYMDAGNKFDFVPHEDFKASIFLKDVDEKTKVSDSRNPKDGSYIGTFETKKKKHKVLVSKSSCPAYLTEKRKVK